MTSLNKMKLVAKLSKYTGITSLCYFLNRNRKKIIAYHNVIADEIWDSSEHLRHSMKLSSFKSQIDIINKKFDVDLNIYNNKSVTVTFDDGYLNQYEVAGKYLESVDLRAYYFCVYDLINSGCALDRDIIEFWISYVKAGTYLLTECDLILEINDTNRLEILKRVSDDLLSCRVSQRDVKIAMLKKVSLEEISTVRQKMYNSRLKTIDREVAKEMIFKGHIIAAHSKSHRRLSDLSAVELENDIRICSEELGKIYNSNAFCYPYGSILDISDKVIKSLKKHGFSSALAYSNGEIKGGYNNYFIPRMYILDTDDEDIINFVLSGAKHFISFRRLLPKF